MTWTGNTEAIPDLASAIVEFHLKLPGWWFSVCECNVSCDASCGPTSAGADAHLLYGLRTFDDGFHADVRQPSTLAEALRIVTEDALTAKADLRRLAEKHGFIPTGYQLAWADHKTPSLEVEVETLLSIDRDLGENVKRDPSLLVTHCVPLTSDWNGPSVHVWGEPGKACFVCQYHETTGVGAGK